jgi:hypothetical protein
MASHDIRAEADRAGYARAGDGYSYSDVPGTGLVGFAALMLALAGAWNVIEGILAIGDSRVYVADSVFVFSDLNSWGWIMLLLGTGQLLASFALLAGSELGRWFGIAVAFLNALGQMFFMTAYPLWAVTMLSIDIVIIYALAMYGGKRLRTE